MEDLKLFVWETVLCDYSCGIMFALAENINEARKMIASENDFNTSELEETPMVYTNPVAYAVRGGG